MGDFSCNKFVTFSVLYKNEHKKNKNGADVIVFHLSMSYVTRPEQKNGKNLYRASQKKWGLLYLFNILGTKKRISKPFFSSEN